jgi:flagellar hook-length control protein FliK
MYDPSPAKADAAVNRQGSADTIQDAAGRFVRGASIEAGSTVQRINVLMQDDHLGRIALRMVDRAGLIHAVVRTDSPHAAQTLTESLPGLLESLSHKGLPASWTSPQGEGQEPQADARQGRPRRQRGGQPSSAGGRRTARAAELVFRVEA